MFSLIIKQLYRGIIENSIKWHSVRNLFFTNISDVLGSFHDDNTKLCLLVVLLEKAMIRNRYNQILHSNPDTKWERNTNS